MAQLFGSYTVTCPVNVAQAAAIEVALPFPRGFVSEIEIVIPDGHAGVTGIAICQAHTPVLPAYGDGTWIVGNDDVIRWPIDGMIDADTWSAKVFNTDLANPHSWYLRLLGDLDQAPAVAIVNPPAVDVNAIYAAAG